MRVACELRELSDSYLLDLLDDAYAALEKGDRASAMQILTLVVGVLAMRP